MQDNGYYQLPFTRNFIPYGDLGVSGNVQRRLYLPDDLIPSLSVLSAQQGQTPRLVTMDIDGGVNVHITGGAGGGGSGVTYAQNDQDSNSTWDAPFIAGVAANYVEMLYCPTYIFGFQYSVYFSSLAASGGHNPFVEFYLATHTNHHLISLGGFFADVGGAGTAGTKSVYSGGIVFDPPMDGNYSLGGSNPTRIVMDCWAGSGSVGWAFYHKI